MHAFQTMVNIYIEMITFSISVVIIVIPLACESQAVKVHTDLKEITIEFDEGLLLNRQVRVVQIPEMSKFANYPMSDSEKPP